MDGQKTTNPPFVKRFDFKDYYVILSSASLTYGIDDAQGYLPEDFVQSFVPSNFRNDYDEQTGIIKISNVYMTLASFAIYERKGMFDFIKKGFNINLSNKKMETQPISHIQMPYEEEVVKIKGLRKDTDDIIQAIKSLPTSREASLAITKLQEGVMWLGMNLKRLGEANPYPSSKDVTTGTKIEPTADGLKL